MQIIIPMSGFGERFRAAGYTVPKPMILMDGKPIIHHVIDMFPGETDFIFICNREHLENPDYGMRDSLESYCPSGKIVAIEPHKQGPVWAVLQTKDLVKKNEPVVVNYCDFTCYWDFSHFKKFTEESGCDGAIPSYRGFHPHTLWSNYYAYVKEKDGWISAIQEKQPYTDDPRSEFASSGTYFFKSGEIMLEYFHKTVDEDLRVNNEYYASMVYDPMIRDQKKIAVYELQHFMQWGTPGDVLEYKQYSDLFRAVLSEKKSDAAKGTVLLPMVGEGKRFQTVGYKDPKPLIPVSGKPMFIQAMDDLPRAESNVFILRKDLSKIDAIVDAADKTPKSSVVMLDKLTEGQASTCLEGIHSVKELPVVIAACDNGLIYDRKSYELLESDSSVDVIVWVKRGHFAAFRRPEMYGWVDADESGVIRSVSVKKPLSSPSTDPIVIGTFTFKTKDSFIRSYERMVQRNARVNNEFYVDMLINDAVELGFNCRIFDIDHYLCWGTPEEYNTYLYWQSCFHKWNSHPYSYKSDPNAELGTTDDFDRKSRLFNPYRPGETTK